MINEIDDNLIKKHYLSESSKLLESNITTLIALEDICDSEKYQIVMSDAKINCLMNKLDNICTEIQRRFLELQ